MTRHWFVRHGESVANRERWLAGHRDVALTERGVAQARALAAVLAPLAPGRVVTSDLRRAIDTAALAWGARAPAPLVLAGLRERDMGAWEGVPLDELRASGGMPALLAWADGPPGGESHLALARRALAFLAGLDDGVDTLWFGHGGWMRTVVGLIDGVPRGEIGAHKVANTELIERVVAPGTWSRLAAGLTDPPSVG